MTKQDAVKTADEMDTSTPVEVDVVAELQAKIVELQEQERRSRADYQNLLRNTREERSKLMKLAALGLVEDLLQPLDHLSMAAEQLKDTGLDMVIKQLWVTLQNHGLEEMQVVGKPFDPLTMEAVEKKADSELVSKVVTRGYRLNGEVIRHAKVIVGDTSIS